MITKYIYGLLTLAVFVLCTTFTEEQDDNRSVELLTSKTSYKVGETVTLEFSGTSSSSTYLYCTSSYGSALVLPTPSETNLRFQLPAHISNKTGSVRWVLQTEFNSLEGTLQILSNVDAKYLETYIGPPSIEAGTIDYTMLVVIPTDEFDNPTSDSTLVQAKHQFEANMYNDDIFTEHLIAYKNIYSPLKDGRMLVSSESAQVNSKEFSINVYPAIPTSFNILAIRPHNFADGNQITTFETSIIKDKHDNIVSDGTYVSFFIRDENDHVIRTSGLTINGIAKAKMIHPEKASTWSVKGYIEGMAESDSIQLTYEQVIKDFGVSFTEQNRQIVVGPLQSFMGQMIPDGLTVELKIFQNDTIVNTLSKQSRDGFVQFHLKRDLFANGDYTFRITAGGIDQVISNKTVW